MFKQIKTNSLSEEVVEQIFKSIKNNELKPGDKLPSEMELTKIFNVSRGTIREAMKYLENFGFISINPGSGTFINKTGFDLFLKKTAAFMFMGTNELKDLMEIRKLLEVYGVGQAARNANAEDITLIEKEIIEMELNIRDERKFIEHDINFHMLINKCSKNMFLGKIVEPIRFFYLQQQINAIKNPGVTKKSLNYHKKIWEAIKNKDVEEAKKEMSDHLENVEEIIVNNKL